MKSHCFDSLTSVFKLFIVFHTDNFPNRAKPRGGIYFMDKLPKTHNGKLIRKEITKYATQQFRSARENDAELQSYLANIPEEFREIIYKCDESL